MSVFSSLSKKHIPTILGLFILGVGLVGGILLVNNSNTNSFLPRASPETTPKNLKITNVTDTSFTVSWVTDSKTPGYIKYGVSAANLATTVTDDRDQISGSVGLFKTHHVTIRSLKANTTYYYKIGTGTKELYDNNGSPYTTTTVQSSSLPAKTVYGEIKSAAGTAGAGALVYVSSADMAPLSAVAQTNGSWVISLATARKKDMRGAAVLTNDTVLDILVVSNQDDTTSVVAATLAQAQPVADITLGKNQDFTTAQTQAVALSQETVPATETTQSKFTAQLLAPATESLGSVQSFAILYPADGEVISATLPEIRGQGPASLSATLSLTGPSAQSATVVGDTKGMWKWTPTVKLKTGTYTLTAKATIGGKLTTLTRAFQVDPSKTTPAFTASTSAVPVPIATSAPTAIPIIQATTTPTLPPAVDYPSTASGQIVSGSIGQTYVILIAGAALLAFGFLISMKKQEN